MEISIKEAYKRASVSLRNKMKHGIELMQKAEKLALAYDKDNGYFLAFSGGKDSQCLYHMAQLAGVKFKAHMSLTSIDPPEVIKFVRANYKDVEMIKPKDSIFNIAVKLKNLPTMKMRWCCAEFKEQAGSGKATLIGIRKQESTRRSRRNEVEVSSHKFSGNIEQLDKFREERNKRKSSKAITIVNATGERTLGCIHGKETLLISPILEWSESDVWEFLNQVVCVPHCELYDNGFKRIGCLLCPMSNPRQKQFEIKKYPHIKKNWIKAIKKIRMGGGYAKLNYIKQGKRNLEKKEKNAKFSDSSSCDRFNDELETEIAENIFDWWISGKSYKKWFAEKFLQQKFNFDD